MPSLTRTVERLILNTAVIIKATTDKNRIVMDGTESST